MLAVRKVLKVKNNEVHISLPSELNNSDVEILVFDLAHHKNTGRVPAGIQFGGSLPLAPGEDIEAELNNLRDEWERPAF